MHGLTFDNMSYLACFYIETLHEGPEISCVKAWCLMYKDCHSMSQCVHDIPLGIQPKDDGSWVFYTASALDVLPLMSPMKFSILSVTTRCSFISL